MAYQDIFSEMESLRREIDEVFRGFGSSRLFSPSFLPGLVANEYPLINLSEDENCFYARALMPGLPSENIDLNITQRTLTITGERKEAEADQQRIWHRRERGGGRFLRAIELPTAVDTAKLDARYRNGILTVTLPKAEAAKTRKIAVKAS
jgi:HSP20 family protein